MKNIKSKPAAYFDVPSMNVQATASQFKQFRTEVADAIREKTGSTDAINPKDFAEQIKNLSGSSTSLGYKYFDVRENPYIILGKISGIFDLVAASPAMHISSLVKLKTDTGHVWVDFGVMCLTNSSGIGGGDLVAVALSKNVIATSSDLLTSNVIDIYDFLTFFETMNGSEDLSFIDFLKSHEITEAEFLEGTIEGLPQMPA